MVFFRKKKIFANIENQLKDITNALVYLNEKISEIENRSIFTSDSIRDPLSNLNKNSIKSIENYNVEALKKMAKMYNIGLSVKHDGKWKALSKNELYNKILEYLNEKKSNL